MSRLIVSNLAVFSTTVPERLGCVRCHRRERERERKNRSLFMRRSQSILLHPLQAAEPVRSVKKLLFLCDFVLLAVQNFISRNTGTFPAPAGSYSDNYSKP